MTFYNSKLFKNNVERYILIFCVIFVIQFGLLNCGFTCVNNPCLNGICIDGLERPLDPHPCFCINGFTGYLCEINWNECRTLPCLNGGHCLDGIASFNCTCPSNFTGSLCQFDLSTTCGSHLQCQNNATCFYDANNTAHTAAEDASLIGNCVCLPGFTGYHCEVETVNCSSTLNVCEHGECIFDNVTFTEHCQCEAGYRGKLCEVNIDECESSPCQHEQAVCLDKVNGFDCACPFGYTGRLCENKLKICKENPCIHGFCLEEENGTNPALPGGQVPRFTCYCTPDYHGLLCEYQYNECEPEPQCHNGGTCIDGVGEFKCSCPPSFYGPICQCSTSTNASQECQELTANVSSSILWWPPPQTSTTNWFLFSSEEWMTTAVMNPGSQEMSITSILAPSGSSVYHVSEFDSLGMSTPFLEEYSTSFVRETEVYVSESAEPLSSTPQPELVSVSPTENWRTSFGISPGSDPESSMYPDPNDEHKSSVNIFPFSSEIFEDPLSTTALQEILNSSTMSWDESMSPFVNETSTILLTITSTIELISTAISPYPTLTTIIGVDTVILPDDESFSSEQLPYFTPSITDTAQIYSEDIITASMMLESESGMDGSMWIPPSEFQSRSSTVQVLPSESIYSSDLLVARTTSMEFSQPVSLDSDTIIVWDSYSTPFQSVVPSTELVGGIPASSSLLSASELQTDSQYEHSIHTTKLDATEIGLEGTASEGSRELFTKTLFVIPTKTVSPPAFEPSSVIFPPTSDEPPMPSTEPEPLATSTSSESPTSTESTPNDTSTDDPCNNYCLHNAKCTYSPDQASPICHCSFKYEGQQCNIPKQKIFIPSFQGNSHLVYSLSSEHNTMIDTSITLGTLVHSGLILYTGVLDGLTYALIFLQNGHVVLHFSCGEQSMSFTETRTRVDTGYNFTLNFKMEMLLSEHNEIHCSSRLTVNNSYTMGGEQIVGKASFQFHRNFKKMYLGGVDVDMKESQSQKHDELIGVLTGFRGCLFQLMLNNVEQDIHDKAIDGRNIGECSEFVCTANPCFGSAKCVPSPEFPLWECVCEPGRFEGIRCQIPICSHNTCLNGGNCTTEVGLGNSEADETTNISTTTEYSHCNCKLGFIGPNCESVMNITQPSFHPVPNYASYISYIPLANFKDWFQLKFHFVTKNMTQFGLLLFLGGRNPYYYHYGHSSSGVGEHQTGPTLQIESPLSNLSEITSNEIMPDHEEEEAEESQDQSSLDFFAISFLQGYLAITWNLGSGVQRISTPHRIDTRLSIHTLYTGRAGRTSWLKVDGMTNVSGTSPGKYKRLDTGMSELFIGGYETFRMEGLPYDLSLHDGFTGCVFDLGFRVKNKLFLPAISSGRNVGNCFTDYYSTGKS